MIKDKYLTAYFGKQSEYYLEKYHSFKTGDKFSFNVGPFLAGLFWFMYRKLWYESLMIFLVLLLFSMMESLIVELFPPSNNALTVYYILSTLTLSTIISFIGNYFYFKKTERKIRAVLSKYADENERLADLKKTGGTSWIPFIVMGIIIMAGVILNNFFY